MESEKDPSMNTTITARIEALLFCEGGPVTKKKLQQILEIDAAALSGGIRMLRDQRMGTGLAVIESETEVTLVIAPAAAETIEKALEREMGKEIGDAGLEVLAILLYRGPSTRSQIDYIRGVNTSSTIRNLAARGLLERTVNPNDAREYLYRPTTELLAYLGLESSENLPEYAKIASELAAFEEPKGPFEEPHGTNHASTSE